MAVREILRSLIGGVAWLVLAALLSLGGAGVAAALNHTPGTAARAELTYVADQAAGPVIAGASSQLQSLADVVDALGAACRDALASLEGGDSAGLQTALSAGTQRLASVTAVSNALAATLASVPYVGEHSEIRLSGALSARYNEMVQARQLVAGLAANWQTFSEQAVDASAVPAILAQHDALTAAAAQSEAGGHYPQALATLDQADAVMVEAQALRDRLGKNADVTTLTAWLNANAAHDTALRSLCVALRDAKGHVTAAVRSAFAAEATARAALPTNATGITVIMSDIARGGLNQAVIAIDTVKGDIANVLAQS